MRLGDKPLRGIVLAGGRSQRFGSDKAMVQLGGVSMLERAIDTLREFDKEPVIIARPDADYRFERCRVERDLIPGCGPLGGLYTAFRFFRESILLVLTCDMPIVSAKSLHQLLSGYDSYAECVHFKGVDEQTEPFPGLYDSLLLSDRAEELLKSKQYSVRNFIDSCRRSKVLDGKDFKNELININHQCEFKRFKMHRLSG